ncbi:MAG: hypothetical protein RQ736_02780 [Thiogranum sp.]|nr:hypothetical protein [Thiogranum sp.]
MQIVNNIRFTLLGGLLLLICAGTAAAAVDELRMGGRTGDILSGSRMIVVNDVYYYVDRGAPIHAPWTDSEFTLDQLRPGMNIGISVLPASADNSLPHIKEIWIYLD